MGQWSTITDRAAGKWQIPLLVVSLLLLAGSVYRSRPTPTDIPVEEAIRQLDSLVLAGHHSGAIELGEVLLDREELSQEETARVQLALGRSRFGRCAASRAK